MPIRFSSPSFRFFYFGAFLALVGLCILFSEAFLVGMILLPVGIYLFISPEITEIDPEKKRFRKGLSLFGWTAASWRSYAQAEAVCLQRIYEGGVFSTEGVEYTERTICYEVSIGPKPFVSLVEVTDYEEAKLRMEQWSEKLDLPTRNIYREIQKNAVERRIMRLKRKMTKDQ